MKILSRESSPYSADYQTLNPSGEDVKDKSVIGAERAHARARGRHRKGVSPASFFKTPGTPFNVFLYYFLKSECTKCANTNGARFFFSTCPSSGRNIDGLFFINFRTAPVPTSIKWDSTSTNQRIIYLSISVCHFE